MMAPPINKKYSYNGYDPRDPDIIAKKAELLAIWQAAQESFHATIRQIKSDLTKGLCTENEYKAAYRNAEETLLTAKKAYGEAIMDMKRGFKRIDFSKVDPAEFSDSMIVNSSFEADEPYSKFFPDGVKNCVFKGCNINNIELPDGMTLDTERPGTNRHFKEQNDREYWLVDKGLNPTEPRNKPKFLALGLSIDPKDIPAEKLAEPITLTSDPAIIEAKAVQEKMTDPVWIKEQISKESIAVDGGK
jgi:hypothetical protein